MPPHRHTQVLAVPGGNQGEPFTALFLVDLWVMMMVLLFGELGSGPCLGGWGPLPLVWAGQPRALAKVTSESVTAIRPVKVLVTN